MPKRAQANKLAELAEQIRCCVKCPLSTSRTNAVPGDGPASAKVMIIGEAPGKDEDQTGHPFVGSAGRYLDHVLEGTDIDRAELFITNTVKCRPPKNRAPKKGEIDVCTGNYLFEQIELINPNLIMLLGAIAAKTVLGIKSIKEARAKIIKHEERKYLVGYHPAVRFYRADLAEKVAEDFALLKRELLKLQS